MVDQYQPVGCKPSVSMATQTSVLETGLDQHRKGLKQHGLPALFNGKLIGLRKLVRISAKASMPKHPPRQRPARRHRGIGNEAVEVPIVNKRRRMHRLAQRCADRWQFVHFHVAGKDANRQAPQTHRCRMVFTLSKTSPFEFIKSETRQRTQTTSPSCHAPWSASYAHHWAFEQLHRQAKRNVFKSTQGRLKDRSNNAGGQKHFQCLVHPDGYGTPSMAWSIGNG